jgi:hypothetical protein
VAFDGLPKDAPRDPSVPCASDLIVELLAGWCPRLPIINWLRDFPDKWLIGGKRLRLWESFKLAFNLVELRKVGNADASEKVTKRWESLLGFELNFIKQKRSQVLCCILPTKRHVGRLPNCLSQRRGSESFMR